MNYPTREEFEELKEEVRQLKEQRTEEMKVTRIEVASEDVIKRLDKLEQGQHSIKQDIAAIHDVFVQDFDRIESTYCSSVGNRTSS